VANFLRRWFGYCLTGHTREQVFVTHWGDGGNGKSVIIDLMARTAGDYSISAPPGMVAASRYDSIKDTELAVLRGRRAVTAHETKQGVELREDFVKLATGSDRITARHLYGMAFEFSPTHKLQLLTNHKPIIKSMDRGTWRRIVLVPYTAAFGDFVGQVLETGAVATHVKDDRLLEVLSTPEALAGILAWRVRGAVEWAQAGLQIPDVVRAASHDYQSEMDRVGQFVAECCEQGDSFSEPLTLGMVGLYPAYMSWCKEGGVHALSRTKFLAEVLRVVPGSETKDGKEITERGRRSVTRVRGLRLLAD
jgi:putative DNA primase/helicase